LLLWAATMDSKSSWRPIVDHLGAAVLVVGCWSIYERVVAERHLLSHIAALFGIGESVREAGIVAVLPDATTFSYGDHPLFREQSVTLVFNDGRKWLSNHFAMLDERFKIENHETELFIVDPEGPFVETLAAKTEDTTEEIKAKIDKAFTSIRDQYIDSPKCGVLKIYFLPLFPTHTVMLGNSQVILTLYTISSGRRKVPLIIGQNNNSQHSMYSFIKDDIDSLRIASKLKYDSSAEVNAPG